MVEGILALATALAAIAGTGLLVMRTSKDPRPELVAWSLTLVGLTVALGAMAFGFLFGFGTALFRAMEFGGAVIAPVWLAVGMVVLISQVVQVRFATWLVAVSYTIVATVIVMLDPVNGKFGSGLPKPGEHYGSLPLGLVDGAHVIAVITLVGCAGFTAWRARNLERAANDLLMQVALAALAGVLVVTGTRGFLPGALAVIALGGATGLVWFGAQKMSAMHRPEQDYDGDYDDGHQRAGAGRSGAGRSGSGASPHTGYDEGPHAGYDDAGYGEAGHEDVGFTDAVHGGHDGSAAGFEAVPGAQGTASAAQGQFANESAGPDRFAPSPAAGRSQTGASALPGAALSGPPTSVPIGPVTGPSLSPTPGLRFSGPEPLSAPPMPPAPQQAQAPPSALVGQVVVFTLREGAEQMFDRLAGEAVRAARELEPDLLVFTCHEVTASRSQRILYRLFRDQIALDAHERQPHIQRFLAESRPTVVATNVVDLRLNAAKVASLPSYLTRDLP